MISLNTINPSSVNTTLPKSSIKFLSKKRGHYSYKILGSLPPLAYRLLSLDGYLKL